MNFIPDSRLGWLTRRGAEKGGNVVMKSCEVFYFVLARLRNEIRRIDVSNQTDIRHLPSGVSRVRVWGKVSASTGNLLPSRY